MRERILKPNGVYRHFKGKFYRLLGINNDFELLEGIDLNLSEMVHCGQVLHTENKKVYNVYVFSGNSIAENAVIIDDKGNVVKDKYVIYMALYMDICQELGYLGYIRPYDLFVSKTDTEKYPNADQLYRFEYGNR